MYYLRTLEGVGRLGDSYKNQVENVHAVKTIFIPTVEKYFQKGLSVKDRYKEAVKECWERLHDIEYIKLFCDYIADFERIKGQTGWAELATNLYLMISRKYQKDSAQAQSAQAAAESVIYRKEAEEKAIEAEESRKRQALDAQRSGNNEAFYRQAAFEKAAEEAAAQAEEAAAQAEEAAAQAEEAAAQAEAEEIEIENYIDEVVKMEDDSLLEFESKIPNASSIDPEKETQLEAELDQIIAQDLQQPPVDAGQQINLPNVDIYGQSEKNETSLLWLALAAGAAFVLL